MGDQEVDRSGYELEFEDTFTDPQLDPGKWIDHFVPHWTTPERSATRYAIEDGGLDLRIEFDQPEWRPEEPGLRASGFQSGGWSGPLGSTIGPHRHGDHERVRTPQPRQALYTPTSGMIEAEMRAVPDPTLMLAFWMVGLEDEAPEHSGEICVVELFGDAIGTDASTLSLGVKAKHDPSLHDDMIKPRLPIDATTWHTYGVEWSASGIRFYLDDRIIHEVRQRFTYPMLVLAALFELPAQAERNPADYPKHGWIRAVRGYRRRTRDHSAE